MIHPLLIHPTTPAYTKVHQSTSTCMCVVVSVVAVVVVVVVLVSVRQLRVLLQPHRHFLTSLLHQDNGNH